jgi:lipoprotein-anchoring transpeptidase ErfK/SrfK
LGAFAVVMAEANVASADASNRYQSQQHQLDQALQDALNNGYTHSDLAPVEQRKSQLESASEPVWVGSRPAYYEEQAQAMSDLLKQLKDLRVTLLEQNRTQASTGLANAKSQLDRDRSLGVDDATLNSIQAEYESAVQKEGAAKTLADYRAVVKAAQQVSDDATKVGAAQQAENDAVVAAAEQLKSKDAGNIDAIRKEGQTALFNARNDASVAAYEARPGRFADIVAETTAYNRLEKYAGKLGSSALDDVAQAAAAAQRYGSQIHDLLMQDLGPKHVVLSFSAQHVWAYENGKVVMDSLVTTGIRGNTTYGTDFGPMKILYRSHPFKFHSPWPKGSPYWYPDATVQWTAFFTSSGEAFHDAYWQPDSTLGPGSQYQSWTRSHGCVHLPFSLAQWMYNWAVEGTPVDVYPGDGTPVAQQLALMTTDDQGNPLNPA